MWTILGLVVFFIGGYALCWFTKDKAKALLSSFLDKAKNEVNK